LFVAQLSLDSLRFSRLASLPLWSRAPLLNFKTHPKVDFFQRAAQIQH